MNAIVEKLRKMKKRIDEQPRSDLDKMVIYIHPDDMAEAVTYDWFASHVKAYDGLLFGVHYTETLDAGRGNPCLNDISDINMKNDTSTSTHAPTLHANSKTLRVKRGTNVHDVLFTLACGMGYPNASELVDRYLAGEWVQRNIGSHGVFHFNHMMEMLGHRPPRPRPE